MTFIEVNGDHQEFRAGVTMTSIYLEQREPARNQRRFYAIHIVETLFGS